MRLLLIKLSQIGDALLLTPTLAAARLAYPQAVIWALVRRGGEGLLEDCPAVDRVVPVTMLEPGQGSGTVWLEDWRLLRLLRRQKFDYAFELGNEGRGRRLCVLAGARWRCTNGCESLGCLPKIWSHAFNRVSVTDWTQYHRVERDYYTVNDCLPLDGRPGALHFGASQARAWAKAAGLGTFAVIHAGSRWPARRWPADRWVAVGQGLLALLDHVVVSTGPNPEEVEQARLLQRALGPRAVGTAGELDWAQLANLLWRAHLFVGVDSAAMHLAAACHCPTVAIFGPSLESAAHPWMVPHRVVVPPHFPVPPSERSYPLRIAQRKTEDVTQKDVMEACLEMLGGGRELPA